MEHTDKGTLFIVSTPIGNLADMTPRAIEVLSDVETIGCEDTRHTKKLLSAFSIVNKTFSLHDHNERQKQEYIAGLLDQGNDVAIVSDAGTPLISDPGFHIVRHCRDLGYKISPIPGACAAIAALSVAGLPTDKFSFEGFLPSKSGARQNALALVAQQPHTMIFYDAPRRAIDTLQDIAEVLGEDRKVVIAREITKTFETIVSGLAGELLSWLEGDANQLKGEMVLIISGAPAKESTISPEVEQALKRLLQDLPPKKACAAVADIFSVNKKDLYQLSLTMKD